MAENSGRWISNDGFVNNNIHLVSTVCAYVTVLRARTSTNRRRHCARSPINCKINAIRNDTFCSRNSLFIFVMNTVSGVLSHWETLALPFPSPRVRHPWSTLSHCCFLQIALTIINSVSFLKVTAGIESSRIFRIWNKCCSLGCDWSTASRTQMPSTWGCDWSDVSVPVVYSAKLWLVNGLLSIFVISRHYIVSTLAVICKIGFNSCSNNPFWLQI